MKKTKVLGQVKKPKRRIIPYIILLVILYFVCIYYGNYILWTLFFATATILPVDFLYFRIFVRGVIFTQKLSRTMLSRFEPLTLNISIEQKNDLLPPKYIIAYTHAAQAKPIYKHAPNKLAIDLSTAKVGRHYYGVDEIYIKSFFGLFQASQQVRATEDASLLCTVLPRAQSLTLEPHTMSQRENKDNVRTDKPTNFDDFIGNRAYAAGDPLKLINFKKSAALRKTMVREFATPLIGTSANIFVDYYNADTYDSVSECVLAVMAYYLECDCEMIRIKFCDTAEYKYTNIDAISAPNDLALHVINTNAQVDLILDTTENKPTAFILSLYDAARNISQLALLPEDSIVFLLCDAVRYTHELEATLASSIGAKVIIIDESYYESISA